MIGKTISHYRILEKLGEGGMGVVYKAEDTKLKRIVALKFLPKELEAHEPERARFLHEAQAASALNHPNICTIHDLQDHEGEYFIVMEYVDGKTLRDMIPLRETSNAVSYAIQIGEALHEAHNHGIVHRDVKPENIMLNAKDQIKVMDFGLAKLKGSLKLTKTSSTVGTLAYMAPEQIQGGEADARGDIFSFGIVLFEMLTGRLPFRGEHQAAMMYSIVNDEPEPIEQYIPDVSPLLANIIQRALEKDPNDRFQSAADMVIELRRLKKKTARVSRQMMVKEPVAAPGQAGLEGAPPKQAIGTKSFKRAVWIGIGTVVLLGIIAGVYRFLLKQPSLRVLNPDMAFQALPIPFTEIGVPGLSRDGAWAAFPAPDERGKYDVYFMNTTSGESRRITSDSSFYVLDADISPDGSQVAYDRPNATFSLPEIVIVSSIGGSSRLVVEGGWGPRWRPDGQRIGYLTEKGAGSKSGKAEFHTIRPNGTDDRRELIDSTSTDARRFSWSPDGRSICWIKKLSQRCQELVVYELSTGKSRQITSDKKAIRDVCWAPNGRIIFSSNKTGNYNLWMIPASGGAETQITKGAGPDYEIGISRDGSKLLYRQEQTIGHIWIAGTDGRNARQVTFDDVYLWRVAFTPDAKKVLFGLVQPGVSAEGAVVCSIDRNGRNRKQLTSGEESVNNPLPSPDGRWIIYGRNALDEPADSSRVYLISAASPGTPRLVGKGSPMRWVDDKTFVSLDFVANCTRLYNIEGGEPTKFFEDSTFAIPVQGGKYIVYYDSRSGREGLWVCAAPGVKNVSLASPKKLAAVLVSGDLDKSGEYFYHVKNTGELRRISIPSGKEETIQGLFPGLAVVNSWFDISYDGKEIVYTDARANTKLIMIENVFK